MAFDLLLLVAEDLESPGNTRNVDSEVVADSAEAAGRAAVILEGKNLPVVLADRKA